MLPAAKQQMAVMLELRVKIVAELLGIAHTLVSRSRVLLRSSVMPTHLFIGRCRVELDAVICIDGAAYCRCKHNRTTSILLLLSSRSWC